MRRRPFRTNFPRASWFRQRRPSAALRRLLPAVLIPAGLALAFLPGVPGGCARGEDAAVRLVTWNVENLFDAVDDPDNSGDDEYTPGGWRRWSDEKVTTKIRHLAQALARWRPDIVCLQEVENRFVLERLQERLRRYHGLDLPYIVHRDGEDLRGIDSAILSRFPPESTDWVVPAEGRRDLVKARFSPGGRDILVFTMHLKSWYGSFAYHQRVRALEASVLRIELERILAHDPSTAIVVTGDMNDHPESRALREIAGFRLDREKVAAAPSQNLLYHLAGEVAPEERGTYYYRKDARWDVFDAIAVSRGMLPGVRENAADWRLVPGSFRVVRERFLLTPEGFPKTFRRVREASGRWVYRFGYSDHLPLVVDFVPRRPGSP